MVERNLAKVEVAGSSPVIRLRRYRRCRLFSFVFSFLLTAGLGEQTFRLGLYFDFVLTDGEIVRIGRDLLPCRAGLKAVFIFDETGSSEPS